MQERGTEACCTGVPQPRLEQLCLTTHTTVPVKDTHIFMSIFVM